jgi:Exonuclease III
MSIFTGSCTQALRHTRGVVIGSRWRAMRIDYCLVSEEMRSRVGRAEVLVNVEGSDHVPIMIEIGT